MSKTLTSTTVRGLFWSLLERGGSQLINLVVAISLARILAPDEFGVIAILLVFISVAQHVVDAGFSSALIQKRDASFVDECSIFYTNIALSVLLASILYATSPFIADFYKLELLAPLGRVLSLNIVLGALGAVHVTLLSKKLNFIAQMKVNLASIMLSGVIGITMAMQGFGAWSLVAQSVSATFTRTALLWYWSDWRPALQFSVDSLRHMFPFGSRLLLSGLLDTVFGNLYALTIGKIYSARDLGHYDVAEQFVKLPVANLTLAIVRVTFPAFATIQDDKDRLVRGIRRALMSTALINFPMMVGLSIVAKPLVLVLLSDKWLPSAAYLQLFCVIGLLNPLHAINLVALNAQGRSDLYLRLEIIKKALIVVGLVVTYRWGIPAMIYAAIVVSCISYVLHCSFTALLLQYSPLQQLKDIIPTLAIAALMGLCIYPLQLIPSLTTHLLLVAQIILGIVVYLVFCRLFRLQSFMNMWESLIKRSDSAHPLG